MHPSHYGYLCPVETPEGPACGLIKAFALSARVTQGMAPDIHRAFRDIAIAVVALHAGTAHYVMLNGEILGETDDPGLCAAEIRRAGGDLFGPGPYHSLSIYVSHCGHHIYLSTDEGRVMRPMLVVDRLRREATAPDLTALLRAGMVRYIDAAEIGTLDVVLTPRRCLASAARAPAVIAGHLG